MSVLEPVNFFLLAGMYGIAFLGVALALLISVDTLAGEITSGTIQTLVTKPLRRWEVVVGQVAGVGGHADNLFTVADVRGVDADRFEHHGGYIPRNPVAAVLLIVLEGLIVLTLSILGGTRLGSLANGVVVFMLYGLAFIAGWIEQIGSHAAQRGGHQHRHRCEPADAQARRCGGAPPISMQPPCPQRVRLRGDPVRGRRARRAP